MADVNWKRNLFFVWLSQMLSLAGFGLCMPFIPLFMREVLKVEESLRGVYVSAFTFAGLVSLCIATAIWGMLGDRFGRKLMLLRASYGAALLYPLLCFAPNVYVLIGIRFLCSFFSGTVNPAQTLLVSSSPPEKHGFVLGVLSTATTGGHMAGYFCGGLIVEKFGYTTAFLTCGALYLIGGLMIQFFVKDNFSRVEAKKKSNEHRYSFRELATPIVVAIMILFVLMGMSRRIDQPFIAMLVEIVHGHKNAAFWTGIASICAAAGGLVAGVLIGWASDRLSLHKMLIPVVIVTAVATLGEAFSGNLYILMATRFLASLGAGGIQPILLMWLSRSTAPELKGTFFGWSGSINVAGGIVSAILSGAVVYCCGVRGVFAAGAVLTLLMLPFIGYTVRLEREKEKNADPTDDSSVKKVDSPS
jgi:DHA1 family multidrug resistance protein-like MFS transporter